MQQDTINTVLVSVKPYQSYTIHFKISSKGEGGGGGFIGSTTSKGIYVVIPKGTKGANRLQDLPKAFSVTVREMFMHIILGKVILNSCSMPAPLNFKFPTLFFLKVQDAMAMDINKTILITSIYQILILLSGWMKEALSMSLYSQHGGWHSSDPKTIEQI